MRAWARIIPHFFKKPPDTEWEPAMPSVSVASEAHQTLLELYRAHPDDEELRESLACAWRLLVTRWEMYTGKSWSADPRSTLRDELGRVLAPTIR